MWVNLDLGAASLPESLGSFDAQCAEFPMESFAFTHQVTRTLACNWKTYADNYLEGYHIPLLHPELNREIDVSRYEVLVFPEDDYCLHTAPARRLCQRRPVAVQVSEHSAQRVSNWDESGAHLPRRA